MKIPAFIVFSHDFSFENNVGFLSRFPGVIMIMFQQTWKLKTTVTSTFWQHVPRNKTQEQMVYINTYILSVYNSAG